MRLVVGLPWGLQSPTFPDDAASEDVVSIAMHIAIARPTAHASLALVNKGMGMAGMMTRSRCCNFLAREG